MTETPASLDLQKIEGFTANNAVIARGIRDYLAAKLPGIAAIFASRMNARMSAEHHIQIPAEFSDGATYTDFSDALPKTPPFIQVSVPRWDQDETDKHIRSDSGFIKLVTILSDNDMAGLVHQCLSETIERLLRPPDVFNLIGQYGVHAIFLSGALEADGTSSDLGLRTSGLSGDDSMEGTLFRGSLYELTILQEVPEDALPASVFDGDFDDDFDDDFD